MKKTLVLLMTILLLCLTAGAGTALLFSMLEEM